MTADVGVALAEHAGRDGDAGRAAADDEDLVLSGGHGAPSSAQARSGRLFPGGIAAQNVAHVGEAPLPKQARGDRRPVAPAQYTIGRLGDVEFVEPVRAAGPPG